MSKTNYLTLVNETFLRSKGKEKKIYERKDIKKEKIDSYSVNKRLRRFNDLKRNLDVRNRKRKKGGT